MMSSRLIFPTLHSLRRVHPKNKNLLKMYSPSDHPRCTVDEFFSSSEQIWGNLAVNG